MVSLFKVAPTILAFGLAALSLSAQAPPAPNPPETTPPSTLLRPALANVQGTTAALNVSKWKASRGVRQSTQADVESIQRDLGSALPGLLTQADAAPGSVPPSFAVYRNLDALYDVLLRVSQTAELAAPSNQAEALAASLKRLEAARAALGDSILNTSRHHEAKIVSLEAAIRTVRTAPPEKKETVVDDGPVKHHTSRRARRRSTHKSTEHKTAPKTAPSAESGK
ncbi:MAG: hypothetical protein ACRD3F_10980 [Acidobacteriaceae bacterium]